MTRYSDRNAATLNGSYLRRQTWSYQSSPEHLLLDAYLTAAETAQALGYAEYSLFHRDFQRWCK